MPSDAMAQLFKAAPANDLPILPNYNICPTTQIHVIYSESDQGKGQRRLVPMRWGFVPHWYKDPNDGPLLINARSETIAEKPAFKAACRERRCLIPMTGFYEWHRVDGDKQPWFISPSDGGPMVVAGIWQRWSDGEQDLTTCAIVTVEAEGRMADIHNRIPVILPQDAWGKWLGEEGHGASRLMTAVQDEALHFDKVGRAVNSNRASGPELIEPIKD